LGGLVARIFGRFPGQQDVLRYALINAQKLRIMILLGKIFKRNNNELVAIYGNFINRVVVLTNKYMMV
jgi:methionyl-tRNA synthetase